MSDARGTPEAGPAPGSAHGPGVRVFRIYAALAFSFAWVPVMYTAFVIEKGFRPDEYARLWSVYYAVMVLAELPWGWVADRWGTKPLLALGPLVLGASFLVLGRADDYTTCLLAMAVTGAAHAMISGADSAWLYDHVRAHGQAIDALHEEAAAHRWRLLGVCVADVAGGALAFWAGTRASFDLAAVLMLGAAGAALALPRAPRADRAVVSPGLPPRRLLADMARPGVLWCFAWFAVVFVLLRVGFQLYQPTLIDEGISSLWHHGAVFGLLNLVAGMAALSVRPVHDRLGERGTSQGVLVFLAVAFTGLALGPAWLLLPMLAMQQVSFAFLQPVGRTALNHRVPSRDRAWMLSVQSVAGRLLFAGVLVLADGDLAVGDLPGTYLALAGASAVLAVVLRFTAPRSAPRGEP
jgi:MFS family permease